MNDLGQRTTLATVGAGFDGTAFALATATGPAYAWSYNNSSGEVIEASDTSAADNDRAYEYDAIGNRKKTANGLIADLPGSDNYATNALNQYTSVPSVPLAPAYDDDGNATAYPLPAHLSANSTLVWDAEQFKVPDK